MDKEKIVLDELVKNALYRLDESTRMVHKSLEFLSEEDLWTKPNAELNSVGNLLLHICGNMAQYGISALGGKTDRRNRDKEFSATGGMDKAALLNYLQETVDSTKRTIFDATTAQWTAMQHVQGFQFSGVGIVLHAVEHYSYHTGQIAFG